MSDELDESAERVYRAMLERPDAEIEVISKIAGLDPGKTHAALSRLTDLALVRWGAEPNTRVRLSDPDTALRALVTQHEAEISARRHRLDRDRVAINQLLALRDSADADSANTEINIERLDGVDAVREKLDELSRTCENEIWSFNPGGPQSMENLERSRPANAATLNRGLRMRALYLNSVHNDATSVEHITWLTDLGAEIRTVLTLPIRMVVVDRSIAVIPVDEADTGRGALVVSEPGMVAGLSSLFVSTWRSARAFGYWDRRQDVERPSDQELHALRLWAQGATDDSVARSLGVSARTVRRMSDALSKRLRARSRFEAGARAVDLGWLTGDDLV